MLRFLFFQLLSVGVVSFGYMALVYERTLNGWWFPVMLPSLGIAIAFLSCLALLYALEGRQRRFIRSAFGHFVSAKVVEQIIANPDALTLGGERRELTIFFSDIAGFTTISENLDPSQLVELLNLYLGELTDIILESGGTLDKYEGDAILAFWNAPLDIEGHAERATETARRCQRRLVEMSSEFQEMFGVFPSTRIGLHTGVVNVGNFGSKSRFDYTVIGDAANLASRIEGLNKTFGTSILISQATYEQLGNKAEFRKVAEVQVVGKKETVVVYSPWEEQVSTEEQGLFERARELFERGELEPARELFAGLTKDPVSNTYLSRIGEELQSDEDFRSVWRMLAK